MAQVTVRDLRNHGGRVLDRVAAGESLVVTRDGKPVAELRPLPGRGLSAEALVERFERLPPIDPDRFRAAIDASLDQSLWPD